MHAESGHSANHSEMAPLLRRRLQILAAVGAFIEQASTIRTAVIRPGDTAHGSSLIAVLIGGTVLAILMLFFLSLRRSAELVTLRRIELVLLVVYFSTVFWRRSGSRPSPRSRSVSTS